MAIPNSIDSATPLGTDTPGAGDDQIRALKLFIRDIFTIPNATSITVAPMSISAAGLVVINDGGADADFRVEGDNNANMIVCDAGTDSLGLGSAVVTGAMLTLNGGAQSKAYATGVGFTLNIPTDAYTTTDSASAPTPDPLSQPTPQPDTQPATQPAAIPQV